MSCIFPTDLSSNCRSYPRDLRDGTTSLGWDMLICRVLNEGSY